MDTHLDRLIDQKCNGSGRVNPSALAVIPSVPAVILSDFAVILSEAKNLLFIAIPGHTGKSRFLGRPRLPQNDLAWYASTALAMVALVSAGARADSRTDMAVGMLSKLKPGQTLEQVKKAIPAGVKLSGPKWEEYEYAIGNYVRLSGKLDGIVVFLNDSQRKVVKEGKYLDLKPGAPVKRHHPSDPLESATVDLGKVQGKAQTAKIIDSVAARLGKPAKREYTQHNDENPSWLAVWRVDGRRTITLSEDSQVHLTATFGTPHLP